MKSLHGWRRIAAGSLVVSILATISLLGCGERSAASGERTLDAGQRRAEFDLSARRLAKDAAAPVAMDAVASTAAPASGASPAPFQSTTATGMIIRNGDISIQVDSIQAAMERVRGLAASLGGYIGGVQATTGEHQVHSATLEMKVPAARFDEAMAGVRPVGDVESSSATAQDVGEEFVDVSARIANGKRLEERLVRLLATRTGKLEDVLAVERELARVREEIERYEGRIRYLSAHIATSTIMVTVHEKPPLVATTPGTNVIRSALIGMWRNMVGVVAFGIEALGAVLPPLVLALIGFLIWRRARRKTLVAAPQSGS